MQLLLEGDAGQAAKEAEPHKEHEGEKEKPVGEVEKAAEETKH